MAISWNAHGSVEIWLLEHLCLDEFARDNNMTRFRTVYLRSACGAGASADTKFAPITEHA